MTNRISGVAVSPIYLRGMRQEKLPEEMCNEEIGAKETDEGADHVAADIVFDDEFNKAQEPVAVSDPRLSDSDRDRNAPAESKT